MQQIGRTRGTHAGGVIDTGDGAQIGPDRQQLAVGHMGERGPRHDLQESAIGGREIAIVGYRRRAVQMRVVKVSTVAHNRKKFREGNAARRQTGLVGRQVTRDDIRAGTGTSIRDTAADGPEVLTAGQLGGRIDRDRVLIQVRIAAGFIFRSRIGGVAAIAIRLGVHDEAAEAYQLAVLRFVGEMDWRDLEADFSKVFRVCIALRIGMCAR